MGIRESVLVFGILAGGSAVRAEPLALDGAVSGGGGKAILCHDGSGAVTSVELLDLWEARTLYLEPRAPLSGNLGRDVDTLLVAMKDAYPFTGEGTVNGAPGHFRGQEYVLARLREIAGQFLHDAPRVHRLRGARLAETNDAMELATPRDCELGQVVNYQQNGFIFVDQDLFEKMDEANRAALLAHEALYGFLREEAAETNSIRARRAVGLAMGGYHFHLENYFVPPAGALVCRSKDAPLPAKNLVYLSSRQSEKGTTWLEVTPFELGGSKLMDASPLVLGSVGLPDANAQEILSGYCSSNVFDVGEETTGSGRVEFDHATSFRWICQNGKVSMYLADTRPGDASPTTSELDCWARAQ